MVTERGEKLVFEEVIGRNKWKRLEFTNVEELYGFLQAGNFMELCVRPVLLVSEDEE
jgi:hypothetical protein